MDAAREQQIERACQRLVTLYCHHVDHGEAARVAELFSQNGRWVSPQITMDGMEEIRRGFALRQANRERMSRHVCNNFHLEIESPDRARGCVYLTLYRYDGEPERALSPLEGPELVGEYRDVVVRTQEGWRFESREIVVSFLRRHEQKAEGGGTGSHSKREEPSS